jgi:hypothetical protein
MGYPGGKAGTVLLVMGYQDREARAAPSGLHGPAWAVLLIMRNLCGEAGIAVVFGGVQREDGVSFMIVGGLRRRDRAVLGSMRGLRGSRPALRITGGPDVENRRVLVIVGGPARDSRVSLVVNAHISA